MPPKKRKTESSIVDVSTPELLKSACVRLYEIKEQLSLADQQISPLKEAEKQLSDKIAQWMQTNQQEHLDVDSQRRIFLSDSNHAKDAKPNARDYCEVLQQMLSPEVNMQIHNEVRRRTLQKAKKQASPCIKVQMMQMVDL